MWYISLSYLCIISICMYPMPDFPWSGSMKRDHCWLSLLQDFFFPHAKQSLLLSPALFHYRNKIGWNPQEYNVMKLQHVLQWEYLLRLLFETLEVEGLLCQFLFLWLMNQLFICFNSKPVSWTNLALSSSWELTINVINLEKDCPQTVFGWQICGWIYQWKRKWQENETTRFSFFTSLFSYFYLLLLSI